VVFEVKIIQGSIKLNNRNITKRIKILLLGLLLVGFMSACSTTHKTTQTARTPIEQLLLSEAVSRSLSQQPTESLQIPQNAGVVLDTSGISGDQGYVKEVIIGWLGGQGYRIQNDVAQATHKINVIVESFGTEFEDTFFGLPPIQGGLIPISTPELALFKVQNQTGYVKLYLNIYELPTGKFVQTVKPYLGQTYYDDYTVMFLFKFNKTDLTSPPDLGMFRKAKNLTTGVID